MEVLADHILHRITTQLINAKLHVESASSALLDDKFEITIKVESEHDTSFNAVLDVMLKPGAPDQGQSVIMRVKPVLTSN